MDPNFIYENEDNYNIESLFNDDEESETFRPDTEGDGNLNDDETADIVENAYYGDVAMQELIRDLTDDTKINKEAELLYGKKVLKERRSELIKERSKRNYFEALTDLKEHTVIFTNSDNINVTDTIYSGNSDFNITIRQILRTIEADAHTLTDENSGRSVIFGLLTKETIFEILMNVLKFGSYQNFLDKILPSGEWSYNLRFKDSDSIVKSSIVLGLRLKQLNKKKIVFLKKAPEFFDSKTKINKIGIDELILALSIIDPLSGIIVDLEPTQLFIEKTTGMSLRIDNVKDILCTKNSEVDKNFIVPFTR